MPNPDLTVARPSQIQAQALTAGATPQSNKYGYLLERATYAAAAAKHAACVSTRKPSNWSDMSTREQHTWRTKHK